MEIVPIASDSLGVRSFCVQIITKDLSILIDPSVSLAPRRYGLPPHNLEIRRMNELWEKILKLSLESDLIVISHYHFDHFSWDEPNQFKGKILLIKHPTQFINFSQRRRASIFLKKISGLPKEIKYCDGKEFKFGSTTLKFSKPVPHGINEKLGFVVELFIEENGESFLFSSDVEGPPLEEQESFILENSPRVVFIDGPMTYMLNYRYPEEALTKSVGNLVKIIEKCKPEKLVLDHHLLRDLNYKERIRNVYERASEFNCEVLSMAEFLGKEDDMLEARRRELYRQFPMKRREKLKKSLRGE